MGILIEIGISPSKNELTIFEQKRYCYQIRKLIRIRISLPKGRLIIFVQKGIAQARCSQSRVTCCPRPITPYIHRSPRGTLVAHAPLHPPRQRPLHPDAPAASPAFSRGFIDRPQSPTPAIHTYTHTHIYVHHLASFHPLKPRMLSYLDTNSSIFFL